MNAGMYSSQTCEWETPQDLFDRLDAIYHFETDVCATAENAKCVKYYTEEQYGLHTDSAEYKMWGNGIALPCAQYVLEGVADELRKPTAEEMANAVWEE